MAFLKVEKLNAELMMFAKPSRLRLFIAEHGAVKIIQLRGLRLVEELGLHKHARNACRPFRLEGHGTVALIGKGIHLLIDNIGGIAYPTLEQLGVLEGGGTDLAVAVQCGGGEQGTLDICLLYTSPSPRDCS